MLCRSSSAKERAALQLAALTLVASSLACCDAECPNGTIEINAHCVKQAAVPNTASGGTGASVSGGSGSTASGSSGTAGDRAAASSGAGVGAQVESIAGGSAVAGGPGAMNVSSTSFANGEPCARAEECSGGYCKNVRNGIGVCCGATGDCCKTAEDCPNMYRFAGTCDAPETCHGTQGVAVCTSNVCGSMTITSDEPCDGMQSPCGLYQDITCIAGRSIKCRTSCTTSSECDANAFCDGRQCLAKKQNGGACASMMECTSNICNNGVCCGANQECCKTVADCKLRLDFTCDDPTQCRGSKNSVMCQQARCVYGDRIDDDSACTGPRNCGPYADLDCNGTPLQPPCASECTDRSKCDENAMCVIPPSPGPGTCQLMGAMAGTNGNP